MTQTRFQGRKGEENILDDSCEEENAGISPRPAQKKPFSVHIRPHVGKLSDYPYCITPQQTVCLLDFIHIHSAKSAHYTAPHE